MYTVLSLLYNPDSVLKTARHNLLKPHDGIEIEHPSSLMQGYTRMVDWCFHAHPEVHFKLTFFPVQFLLSERLLEMASSIHFLSWISCRTCQPICLSSTIFSAFFQLPAHEPFPFSFVVEKKMKL